MARSKIGGNRDESKHENSGDSNLVSGGNGEVSAEDIRPNEGTTLEEGIFDPGKLDSGATGETGESAGEEWFPKRNKRGRKPKASKETQADLNGLLWMIHQGLATLTGVEEFALDPSESKELAEAIARVQAFYPNAILSPIAMAWTGLFVTSGKVYGPRVIAHIAKKKRKPHIVEIPTPPGTVAAGGHTSQTIDVTP